MTKYELNGNWSAFPIPPVYNPVSGHLEEEGTCGMTLRQWYAGMALQGMIAGNAQDGGADDLAAAAFEYADAMIKASHE